MLTYSPLAQKADLSLFPSLSPLAVHSPQARDHFVAPHILERSRPW